MDIWEFGKIEKYQRLADMRRCFMALLIKAKMDVVCICQNQRLDRDSKEIETKNGEYEKELDVEVSEGKVGQEEEILR